MASAIKFSELKAAYVSGGSGANNHAQLTDDSTTSAISLSYFRNSGFTNGSSVPSSGSITMGSFTGKTFGSSGVDHDSVHLSTITSDGDFIRHGYTTQSGYVSHGLWPASSAGYARIEYKITNAGSHNPHFIGLIAASDSPAADGNYEWTNQYSLNYLTNNLRVVYTDPLKFISTGISVTNTDLLSITYDSGTITFAKNGTSVGFQLTGLATDIVFHAKIESYIYPSGSLSTERIEYHDVKVYDSAPS